jgi:hypothetical protein
MPNVGGSRKLGIFHAFLVEELDGKGSQSSTGTFFCNMEDFSSFYKKKVKDEPAGLQISFALGDLTYNLISFEVTEQRREQVGGRYRNMMDASKTSFCSL